MLKALEMAQRGLRVRRCPRRGQERGLGRGERQETPCRGGGGGEGVPVRVKRLRRGCCCSGRGRATYRRMREAVHQDAWSSAPMNLLTSHFLHASVIVFLHQAPLLTVFDAGATACPSLLNG